METGGRQVTMDVLRLDCAREAAAIAAQIRVWLRDFRKHGAIVAMSGGIDSSVVAALCVRAVGPDRVLGLLLPEADSSAETLPLSKRVAEMLGIQTVHTDISDILSSAGCYARRDEAIRRAVPEYGPGYRAKIVLPSILEGDSLRLYSVVVRRPDGLETRCRLDAGAYLGIVAATNFKQRVRKMLEYYHADRLNYAVAGTPNRLEYELGFFVKLGDGAADMKPIAHLYKTQVYQMAAYVGIPEDIRTRPPTTDTYSLPQSQDEFYFSLPYDKMDLCLYAANNGIPAGRVTAAVGLREEQVNRVFADIEQKRRATRYLHMSPQVMGGVATVGHANAKPLTT